MRRRFVSVGSIGLAVVALALVLYNATLVDRRAPTIAGVSLSAPAGEPTVAQTVSAIDIEFSEPVDRRSVERRIRIEPYVAGTVTWDGPTAIFSPSQKLPQDTEFQLFVDPGFSDLAGNVSAAGLDGWAFRTVGPPAVVAIEPLDGAERVPLDGPITITFDRLMDTAAVEDAISLEPTASFSAAWSGRAVTLTVDGGLDYGTEYTLRVGTGAADTDGNRLGSSFGATFATVAAGLGVRATVPADAVAGVGVRSPIAVLFDGPIDPATVEDALQITPPVAGTVELLGDVSDAEPRPSPGTPEADPSILVFRPNQPLAPHTTYTVTLAPIVAPVGAPGEVAAGRTWRFTTGQPVASGQNQIAWFSDRAGVRNVWLMNPDGSNPRQLTTELVPVSAFDVRADGSQVAWSAGGVVKAMAIDGSDERVLTTDGRFEYAPRFSPDGRSLLVARRDPAGTDLGVWLVPLDATAPAERQVLPAGAPPLGSVALDGTGIDAGDGYPVWATRAAFSPDGSLLAVTGADGVVRMVDLADDAAEEPIETGVTAEGPPVWSTSSGVFLVVGRVAGDAEPGLQRLALDGAATRIGPALGSVATSGDGRVAILVRGSDGFARVAVGPSTGPVPPRLLTDEPGLADRWPSFSPDGASILFGRVAADAPTASQGIWIVDASTGRLVRLTTDGAYPRWLP